MIPEELLGVFLLGLLGSTHCLGMCSGFVLALRGRSLAYQAGRLLGYGLIGAAVGGAGLAIHHVLGSRLVQVGAGLTMVWLALGWLGAFRTSRVGWRPLAWLLTRVGPLLRRPGWPSALGFGLLTALLPCGLLAAAWLRSAATGSPEWGALTMVVFWAGTVPALGLVGWLGPWIRRQSSRWWPRLAAMATLWLGLWTLVRAFLPGPECCGG